MTSFVNGDGLSPTTSTSTYAAAISPTYSSLNHKGNIIMNINVDEDALP